MQETYGVERLGREDVISLDHQQDVPARARILPGDLLEHREPFRIRAENLTDVAVEFDPRREEQKYRQARCNDQQGRARIPSCQ